ncbi:MAG: toll/interleukin-1 receptor domain-containing protein [Acidobacteriota bacterium]
MPTDEDHRIFISYAHRDGVALAARLQQDLTASEFDAWLDNQRLVAGAVWTAEIEREIDTRPVTLALLTPGSYESEICRAEQLRALRKGKRLIPVLAAPGADRPLHLEARQYRDLTDPGCYAARFQELVADIRGGVTAKLPESYRETRVTYLTAPRASPTTSNGPRPCAPCATPCSPRTAARPSPSRRCPAWAALEKRCWPRRSRAMRW